MGDIVKFCWNTLWFSLRKRQDQADSWNFGGTFCDFSWWNDNFWRKSMPDLAPNFTTFSQENSRNVPPQFQKSAFSFFQHSHRVAIPFTFFQSFEKAKTSNKPLKSASLGSFEVTNCPCGPAKSVGQEYANSFQIVTPDRIYILYADSPSDLETWKQQLILNNAKWQFELSR